MTPTGINYGTASGGSLTAGRFAPSAAGRTALLDAIAAQPAGSGWLASTNTFESVWPSADYANTGANPPAIMYAWPSAAWDSKRWGMWLWGGGHANSSSNEVYFWSAITGQWQLAFLPSEFVELYSNGTSIDGRSSDFNASPVSSHTYHGNCYLPILDRFLTFGGASQPSARSFQVWDESNPTAVTALRHGACFTLNPELLGLGFVGGKTGAHAHRNTSVGVDKYGARAWQLHDWFGRANPPPNYKTSHINCGAQVTQENGHDVVYFMTQENSAGHRVNRVEFVDLDPANDIVTPNVLGGLGYPGAGIGTFAYDPVKRIGLCFPGNGTDMVFFDAKRTFGGSNDWQIVPMSSVTGAVSSASSGTSNGKQGLVFDKLRNKFVIYNLGSAMWEITSPAGNPTPTAGWSIQATTYTGTSPPAVDEFLMGMFKYADGLGVYCSLYGSHPGEVYFHKPVGWTDLRG